MQYRSWSENKETKWRSTRQKTSFDLNIIKCISALNCRIPSAWNTYIECTYTQIAIIETVTCQSISRCYTFVCKSYCIPLKWRVLSTSSAIMFSSMSSSSSPSPAPPPPYKNRVVQMPLTSISREEFDGAIHI